MCQNSTVNETMVRYIHSMVDKAKSLGDQPSVENFYIFRAMVRDEGERCLAYVNEADRIRVHANYRRDEAQAHQLDPSIRRRGKGGVAGRRARAIERGQVLVETNEAVSEDDQATCDIGSTSRGHTQEFTPRASLENVFSDYQPQYFENAPNFASSPVPMSIDIPDATNNLEQSNTDIEGNEFNGSNDEVENENEGGEPMVKEKRTIFPKRCGTGSHYLYQHGKKKTAQGNKD